MAAYLNICPEVATRRLPGMSALPPRSQVLTVYLAYRTRCLFSHFRMQRFIFGAVYIATRKYLYKNMYTLNVYTVHVYV